MRHGATSQPALGQRCCILDPQVQFSVPLVPPPEIVENGAFFLQPRKCNTAHAGRDLAGLELGSELKSGQFAQGFFSHI